MNKMGDMRRKLLDAIDQVASGNMKPEQGLAIAKLAGAINTSLTAEVTAVRYQETPQPYGELPLDAALDGETTHALPAPQS